MADWYSATNSKTNDTDVPSWACGDWMCCNLFSNSINHNTKKSSSASPTLHYKSRRSPVLCQNGCVSSSQPLASSIGLQILLKGGNAADAAVATAAALAVLEPCSTGLGGDVFALYYDAKDKKVNAINGSGRCPGKLNLDMLQDLYPKINLGKGASGKREIDGSKFLKSVHSVTVPGAARGWEDFYNQHASKMFSFLDLLEPAAKLAEEGFPVAPITAKAWSDGLETDIKKWIEPKEDGTYDNVPLSVDGQRGPKSGEIIHNPEMASVLRSLGTYGATQGFYQGFPGEAIVEAIQSHGGVMDSSDMEEEHTQSTYPEPIQVEYKGLKLWQIPPNGQGIAGLIALSGFSALEEDGKISSPKISSCDGWDSTETWHAMFEMMKLGFADARAFICDPDYSGNVSTKSSKELLDKARIANRATKVFNPKKAVVHGLPDPTSCTVSFQVVDSDGNAVSFVNSNFMGFGTGLVPKGCGFTLQNRGNGFSLDSSHPNALMPRKRPYHTIIPGMLTHADTNELYATISNMGGNMQPQGHFQLTVGLTCGLDPQAVVDMPRFCIADGTYQGKVLMEEGGVDEKVVKELRAKGHVVDNSMSGYAKSIFGKAQIIKRDRQSGVLWAGSDGRSDGCAMGY